MTKGIVYYTHGQAPSDVLAAVRKQLDFARGKIPFVSVSLAELNWPKNHGQNLVLPLEPSIPTMFRQQLAGLQAIGTDIAFCCEHDVLYHPSHFDFTPPRRQGIVPGQLTIHADRGSPMKSQLVAQLLADLGITKTHSRPHVSNDNPYSQSQFKTLKTRSGFPGRFRSLDHARAVCGDLLGWYINEHRHSGLGLLTPNDVHHGLAAALHGSSPCRRPRAGLRGASGALPTRHAEAGDAAKEVWINKPRIVTFEPIPGTTTETDAQNRARTNALDPGIHPSTPEIKEPELVEVVL